MVVTVCVTGASGFIGSHIVKLLLEKNIFVRATVTNINDKEKYAHLLLLPGAQENLNILEANLHVKDSFENILSDCYALFHTAFFMATKNEDGKDIMDEIPYLYHSIIPIYI